MEKGVRHVETRQISQSALQTLIDAESGTNKLLIILMGKYGMREGEIVHMRKSWIHINDEEAKIKGYNYINIPRSGVKCDCDKCLLQGYNIRKRNKYIEENGHKPNKAWYAKIEKRFYRLLRAGHKFKRQRWTPKSDAGKRIIPLLFEEYNDFILKYFDKDTKKVGLTRQAIWQRVYRAGKKHLGMENIPAEDIEDGLSPHPLRSTAAQFFADNGMTPVSLCAVMGWKDISVADVYVRPKTIVMAKEFGEIVQKLNNETIL